MEDEERLENIAIKAFKQHWTKILKTLEKGKNTYANKLYGCFEADTVARQKQLADKFYGIDHARKMARLSDNAIRRNLSCYLPQAIEYALFDNENDPKEQESFMKKLVTSEYVIFRSNEWNTFDSYDENVSDLTVAEYPARVAYDDWFEASVGGGNICYTAILMKSTGESFSKEEVSWLKKSIQHNIDGFDHLQTLWSFECEPLTKTEIWVRINEFTERWTYIEEMLGQVQKLSRKHLNAFVRKIVNYLSVDKNLKGKKLLSCINVLENYESMKKDDLEKRIEDFFLENEDEFEDMDIRILENFVNDMLGTTEREYHSQG
jgi:hypothetical protein